MDSRGRSPVGLAGVRPEPTLVRPLRTALAVAGGYLAVSAVYILVSGRLAALLSSDKSTLESIERLKGCAFVGVTGALLFAAAYAFLKRLSRREQELGVQRRALLAAERRAAAGLFAASVAHDLNNLITVYDDAARCLTETPQSAAEVAKLSAQLCLLNEELRGFAKRLRLVGGDAPALAEALDLCALVTETVGLARRHEKAMLCHFESDLPAALPWRGDPALLRQALLNLILNAADATGNHGGIRVVVRATSPGECRIEVHDNGPGVPPALAARICQPLFTTKPDGSGLGLLSVRHCAERHGGKLEFGRSEPLGGAVFRLSLRAQEG